MNKRRFLTLLLTLSLSSLLPAAHAETSNPQLVMTTSEGVVEIELLPERAPKTVANFLRYVDAGFYSNTLFHRIIPDFMIQGGGFEPGLIRKKTFPPVENESVGGLNNSRGTLAMARTNDPDSATAQFFINTVDNLYLDSRGPKPGYTVFGRVTAGMDVVDAISHQARTRRSGHGDVPVKDIVIESIVRK